MDWWIGPGLVRPSHSLKAFGANADIPIGDGDMRAIFFISVLVLSLQAEGKRLTERQRIEARILNIMRQDPDAFDVSKIKGPGALEYACFGGAYSDQLTYLCFKLILTQTKEEK